MEGLLATLGGLTSGIAVSPAPGQGGGAEFGARSGSLFGPGGGGGGLGGGGGGEGLEGAGQLKQGTLSFPGVSVTWVPGILSSAEHVCSHIIQCHLRIELMF